MSIIPGTPKSTLTVRELDGTPSGSATTLIVPNGSLSFSASDATIDLVSNADSRLGVIWDAANEQVALSSTDAEWTFADTTTRDNLRTALQAVATTDDRLGVVYDPTNEDAALSCNNQLWTFLDGTTRDNLRTALQAAAATHTHGNITSSGTIGTTADLILGTGTAGAIETKSASDVRTILGLATTDSPTFAGITTSNGKLSFIDQGLASISSAIGGLYLAENAVHRVRVTAGGIAIRSGSSISFTNSNTYGQDSPSLVSLSANTLTQLNGTNGQVARWAKTWTSATNNELLELDCAGNATTFDLAVCSGSAGGSNRGFRIGSKFAGGAFSSWLSFDTAGAATYTVGNGTEFRMTWSSVLKLRFDESKVFPSTNGGYNLGTSALRWGTVFAQTIDGSSDLTIVPSASRTLSTNGQFTIERVSNTEVNLVYRGDDGVTRRLSMSGFA